jgi:serine/threonine protein kinase/GAF domain-containing protein
MTKAKRRIGRFEIARLLGEGSQSAVYLAYDPHLEREVAIKTLHFAGSDPAQNPILLAEARTVSKLRHAHIVPIFEAGEEDGDPYLVFEYVEGRTLADLIRAEGSLPAHRAVKLMAPVLDAIGHAHRYGVIHRDLKPSNILIDADGVPKVMDFGIATRVNDPVQPNETLRGTPVYMAPEYVISQVVGPKLDIYAAGLILYELLFGHRAIQADDVPGALQQVATQPVELPAEPALPEPLRNVVVKALARDPDLRFESAEAMKEALEAYLKPPAQPSEAGGGQAGNATLEFLLRHMRHKSDFPALSTAIGAINRLATSENESVGSLSSAILKDFALTNKILRVVNSPHYRAVSGGNISTVSRGIVVLGFNTIRSIAVSLILFEHLQNKTHAGHLKEEFVRANLCGLLAREMAGQLGRDSEESFICALFHGLGRLLTQYYFPEEAQAIKDLGASDAGGEESASARVLGIAYQDLGIGIARHWGFPETIIHSMRRLPAGRLPHLPAREDRLRALAGFANEAGGVIENCAPERRARELSKLVARFSEPLGVNERQLHATLERTRSEILQFADAVHIDLKQTRIGRQLLSIADPGAPRPPATAAEATLIQSTLLDGAPESPEPDAAESGPDGYGPGQDFEAVDVQAVLTAGIQDISNSLVDGFLLDDLLRIVLETMYRAMGFQRVLLCLRDGRTNTMNGRIGFGADADEVAKRFSFKLGAAGNVFNLALSKGADILIGDAGQAKIAGTIPEWYRKAVGAPTFLVFPLHIKTVPVGMIYADHSRAGGIVLSDKELALLRTLRNQAVLAIKQST